LLGNTPVQHTVYAANSNTTQAKTRNSQPTKGSLHQRSIKHTKPDHRSSTEKGILQVLQRNLF